MSQTGAVTPELKGADCFDHDPIDQWEPDHESVYYWLTLHVGPPGTDAADLYQVPVCTHPGLQEWKQARSTSEHEVEPIVLAKYSWRGVMDAVQERLASCRGHDWLDVQGKLRRCLAWEYEAYS